MLLLTLSVGWLGGCKSGRPSSLPPVVEAVPPWLAAPASARVVVRVAPRELLTDPGAVALWESFVDPERERGFTERTGIDPRALFELVFVELSAPEGAFVLLLRGPFDAEQAVREAGERLAFVEVSAERPYVRREGLRGKGRWAYAALEPDTLLLAEDVPPVQLAAFIDRLRGTPSELTSEARALGESLAEAPLAVLVPTPLEFPGSSGAALLLARQQALALSLRPVPGAFDLELDLRGEFPTTAEDNFQHLIDSVANTQLGQDLGLSTALPSLRVAHDPEAGKVQLGLRVEAQALVQGLRLLFSEELSELFQ